MTYCSFQISSMRILSAGIIKPKASLSHSERLGQIHDSIFQLANKHQPDHSVIEKGFTGINAKTALRLGETRGAIIAAMLRAHAQIHELSPTQVKKQVTGRGHASKEDVARSLQAILGFDRGSLPHDVTDAVAIAYSFSLQAATQTKLTSLNLNPMYHLP